MAIHPPKLILLDADEVVVDFIGGVCDIYDISRESLERSRKPGEWGIEPALSRVLNRPIDRATLWREIHLYGEHFWAELRPLPWALELIEWIEAQVGRDWHFVTGPSLCHSSYSGKARWFKRYFGRSFDRFHPTIHKEILARPSSLLLDDRESNCNNFVRHGGKAIIFPSYGNRYRLYAANPVQFLKSVYVKGLFQCT